MPSEYEDKFLLLRDENLALKKKKNEQETTIKRMYTKLAMIEEKISKTRMNNQDDLEMGRNIAVVPVRRDREVEKFIAALKIENNTLKKKNQTLIEKNRWLAEKCRQSSTSKQQGGESRLTMRKKAACNMGKSDALSGNIRKLESESARKFQRGTFSGDLEVALKKRLITAEKQLNKLQTENAQLRMSSDRLQSEARRNNNEVVESSYDEGQRKLADSKEPLSLEHDLLKRELQDRIAQLAILNARYENLELNALAEREIQEKTLEQMDQMNRQVHKLRMQLQDAIVENEELEIRVMKACDQEKEYEILRQQNRRLEERMTVLCESPFINNAFQRKERIDRLLALEKLTEEQKATISQVSEENQKLHGAIRELQESIKQSKQAKDRVEQDLAQLAHHLMEKQNERSLDVIKSTAISGSLSRLESMSNFHVSTPGPHNEPYKKRDACSSPTGNDVAPSRNSSSVNVGGGVVNREYESHDISTTFLDSMEEKNDHSINHLQNRVHVLRVAHLKAVQELERCEKMLQAQININRDLALEIEELAMFKISTTNQLQRHMKDLEILCEERQQRIQNLETETRQLKYALELVNIRVRGADDEGSESGSEICDAAFSSESLVLAAQDLAPGKQLLELKIINGHFDDSAIGIKSSTFILCDFYDFETQATPIVMGNRPHYNLSVIFKVSVDGFFLRYLAAGTINLEVHQVIRGEIKLIGESSICLSKLLQSNGVVEEPKIKINSVTNTEGGRAVLGTLNIIMSISTSILKVWQVHLRSYPQDITLFSKLEGSRKQTILPDALYKKEWDFDESIFTNELQITVFACRNLPFHGKQFPSSYAHYQLLGFPDVFTNIVPESACPKYDLSCSQQAFALKVDACLLRFLSKFRLEMAVFDDQANSNEIAKGDELVGRCKLLLSDLVRGEDIRGWFPLNDRNERHAGDIFVLIHWKDLFQVLRLNSLQQAKESTVDMHSLNYDQQHALLSMFLAGTDGRVNYRQFLHYAAPSEDLELLMAKMKERLEYAMDAGMINSVHDAFVVKVDGKHRKQTLVPIETIAKSGENYGIFLSDVERDILQLTFNVTDAYSDDRSVIGLDVSEATKNYIAVDYLLLHINPRSSCSERLLCFKIRQTLGRYIEEQSKRKASDIVQAWKLFENFDDDKCGRLTRSTFRKCLSALGFNLVNAETEYRELIQQHTKDPCSSGKPNNLTTFTFVPTRRDCISGEEINSTNDAIMSSKEAKISVASFDPGLPSTTNVASIEFQRRKRAFLDRMKAVASSSSKSLVYEHVEKKLGDAQTQVNERKSNDFLYQKGFARQLHLPRNLQHEETLTLQKQCRQYKESQQKNLVKEYVKTTLIEADIQLQIHFSKWRSADLAGFEVRILADIMRDFPEAVSSKVLTKKQVVYFFSRMPQVELPPALLWQIMDYFLVKESGMVAFQSLLKFIFSTSTGDYEQERRQRLSVLRRLYFDLGYASYIFMSTGDIEESGLISIKKFHEGLSRLGVQLSTEELYLLTIMFDANGHQILYHALLHILTQLPHCQQLAEALERCRSAGISFLREKMLTSVNSDDHFISHKNLLQVLMQQNSEKTQFATRDARLLFQMVGGSNNPVTQISIQDICSRLEAVTKYSQRIPTYGWNKYDLHHLQQLAWNCRKFTCGSLAELQNEFERYDWQKHGQVSLETFVSIASHKGFLLLTEVQLKGIAKNFGEKANGSFGIRYREFLEWTTPPPPVDMDAVEKKLRETAQEQANKLPSKQLSEVYNKWNQIFLTQTETSSKGAISRSNFVRICNTMLRLPLNENEMRTLLYTYDPELHDLINSGSFLRMNWREAKSIYEKHSKAIDARVIQSKISEKLQDEVHAAEKIAEAFSYNENTSDSCVECDHFITAMQKLGIALSPSEVQSLYVSFGEPSNKQKLDFVKFFKHSFGIHVLEFPKLDSDRHLSYESEKLLNSALETAVGISPSKIQKSFMQFQEFCVVHRFSKKKISKLWRQMKANGLINILSSRVVGLLLQKFSSTLYKSDGDLVSSVSLKAVHRYLRNFLSGLPIDSSQKDETLGKSTELVSSGVRSKTAMIILSDLADSCDERGVDYRAEFEAFDNLYTGCVTAKQLKRILLCLDIAKYASPLPAETVIGQLVRQFRSSQETDAVQYTKMLYEAVKPFWSIFELRCFDQTIEHLRSRIRLKSNLAGKIDHFDELNYARLDATFSHFDLEKKGYLTAISISDGLRALNYDLSPAQISTLMLNMSVFCHDGGGLSRTEFDSFALDPYAARLLKDLSNRLYFDRKGLKDKGKAPRIAYLSRLLTGYDGQNHQGSLVAEIFWTQLERTLEKQITELERQRLKHLFDVERNGCIAYRLFLKVMSQLRASFSKASLESARASSVAQRQEDLVKTGVAATPNNRPQSLQVASNDTYICACDATLRSLSNQMSSIDFDSQLEIVEEYLRMTDPEHSGSIEVKQLKRVFDQIGLSLSADALMSLQLLFPGQVSSDAKDEQKNFVAYKKLLLALNALHQTNDDQ
ncbi:Protein of unknown function DUF3250 [Plasmopara halstedii]|uniref:Uncharacterized protein n=1 Tax=Plasmopara halstedii TaxID=4781 RepID=A0A0P1B5L7_PLAHL|nr:Protein of unknown function DUF3250 [Plasmopara halstedii]CEG49502.1 Protein of unknown function DUF3250 [Plasmopara halstedii]|eukprot:XP_024585871.1 Protein of unknown function DUF3250 [Plasmopara halstedii]